MLLVMEERQFDQHKASIYVSRYCFHIPPADFYLGVSIALGPFVLEVRNCGALLDELRRMLDVLPTQFPFSTRLLCQDPKLEAVTNQRWVQIGVSTPLNLTFDHDFTATFDFALPLRSAVMSVARTAFAVARRTAVRAPPPRLFSTITARSTSDHPPRREACQLNDTRCSQEVRYANPYSQKQSPNMPILPHRAS